MNALGRLVRDKRIRLGWTQETLSARAGVSVRTVRDVEKGRAVRLRPESSTRLATVLGLDLRTGPRIGVLGPLTVHVDSTAVDAGSAKPRLLLCLLALHAGEVVGRERIAEVLWGEQRPATWQGLVQGYVTRLRRVLTSDLLVAAHGGYRLRADEKQLDLAAFDALVAGARRQTDGHAAEQDLHAALTLWRGPLLADQPDSLRLSALATAITERRVAAALTHADLALARGASEQALTFLRPLADDDPVHEPVHARLMLALAGAGRQAEALEVFTLLRDRLAVELGVEPGEELRAAHLKVLRQEVTTRAGTALDHLPADVTGFTGRSDELARLDTCATDGATVVLHGAAGTGKTALALRWGHRTPFPDGRLYADLRGFDHDRPPVEPGEVLGRFLRALGAEPHEIPRTLEELTSSFRERMADRRMLVVLDDAVGAAQVLPLLPRSAHAVVLVTSRTRLGLGGARSITLDGLSLAESLGLLENQLGRDRVRQEPAAAAELVARCGHLPLALRVVASRPPRPDQTLASMVTRVRSASLRHTGVRAAFELSYRALAADEQRLFRRLGLVPGADFGVAAARTLLDDPGAAPALLARLTTTHLVESHVSGRYRMHALLREYALERCTTEESEEDSSAALRRLCHGYLSGVQAAARVLYPSRRLLPDLPGAAMSFTDPAAAWKWLDTELPNVIAVTDAGVPEVAWHLADALRGFFIARPYHHENWQRTARAGLAAAEREGEERAQAAMHLNLGGVRWAAGDSVGMLCHSTRAVELAEAAGWQEAAAKAISNVGYALLTLDRPAEAVAHVRLALDLIPAAESVPCRLLLAATLAQTGDLAEAELQYETALAEARVAESAIDEMEALVSLGWVTWLRGDLCSARDRVTGGLALARKVGSQHREAFSLALLAEIACHDDAGEADQLIAEALAISEASQQPRSHVEVLTFAGRVRCALASPRASLEHHREALDLARSIGDSYDETDALIGLAITHLAAGSVSEAVECGELALVRAVTVGYKTLAGQARSVLARAGRR